MRPYLLGEVTVSGVNLPRYVPPMRHRGGIGLLPSIRRLRRLLGTGGMKGVGKFEKGVSFCLIVSRSATDITAPRDDWAKK